ncbi:hypothetical protein, partial [Salipiger aestuarii]|uniref:hypothetical protein n=1 Tax=Salipiger aestuarii TaxID=568098 RepID=UPI001CC29046
GTKRLVIFDQFYRPIRLFDQSTFVTKASRATRPGAFPRDCGAFTRAPVIGQSSVGLYPARRIPYIFGQEKT